MKITFHEEAPMTAQLTLSTQAYSDIQSYIDVDSPKFAISNDIVFDFLDEMYGGLVPHEDIGDGTYKWVCNFSGGKFYANVGNEDSICLRDGI
jgi:hypothetical protein